MSYGEPRAADLIEAAAKFLEDVAAPALSGHAAFHARVAVNALRIAAREAAFGPQAEAQERDRLAAILQQDGAIDTLRRAACAAIRDGRLTPDTPGLLEALLEIAAARVRIEQPGYASLARIDAG